MSEMVETANTFEALLPAHKASLHLTHNQHLAYYETVEGYLETSCGGDVDEPSDWAALGEREKAIATNSLWELQWYPETPIGSYSIYASSLAAIIEFIAREFPPAALSPDREG